MIDELVCSKDLSIYLNKHNINFFMVLDTVEGSNQNGVAIIVCAISGCASVSEVLNACACQWPRLICCARLV